MYTGCVVSATRRGRRITCYPAVFGGTGTLNGSKETCNSAGGWLRTGLKIDWYGFEASSLLTGRASDWPTQRTGKQVNTMD